MKWISAISRYCHQTTKQLLTKLYYTFTSLHKHFNLPVFYSSTLSMMVGLLRLGAIEKAWCKNPHEFTSAKYSTKPPASCRGVRSELYCDFKAYAASVYEEQCMNQI